MGSPELRRVILVDDSPDDAEFVRRALAARYPDGKLVVFRTGREALAHLAGGGPSAGEATPARMLLLDLKLPGLDGHAILAELRSRYSSGELPVVVFTSSREPLDVARAYAAGANSYLVKPMVFEEYVSLVELAVRYWVDANVRQEPPERFDA